MHVHRIYIIENDEEEIEFVKDPNQNSEDDFVNIDEDEEDDY